MTHIDELTAREREIADLVAKGLRYSQIAAKLSNLRSFQRRMITERTVQAHVSRIRDKVDPGNPNAHHAVVCWAFTHRKAA